MDTESQVRLKVSDQFCQEMSGISPEAHRGGGGGDILNIMSICRLVAHGNDVP